MAKRLNIAIAGCGIGGLAAAILLRRDGHGVTVFDRFDRPTPVGSGLLLQPTGLAILDRLGLRARIETQGERVIRLVGHAGRRRVLDVEYSALGRRAYAIGIHRAALFDPLFEAAMSEGVAVEAGHCVTRVESHGSLGRLHFESGAPSGGFDLVVDASGSRSMLAKGGARPLAFGAVWTTVSVQGGAALPSTLTQRYRAAREMAGLLPVGRPPGAERPHVALFWSIRADRLDPWRQRGLAAWQAEWSRLWPEAADYAGQVTSLDQFEFAAYRHRTAANPGRGPLIHIGDAWHSTSPQLGQGANMAMLDAWALARSIREAADVTDGLERFVRSRTIHVHLYQLLSLTLTPLYQSDHVLPAWLRDTLMAPLLRLPGFRGLATRAVAGLVGARLRQLGLGDTTASFTGAGNAR